MRVEIRRVMQIAALCSSLLVAISVLMPLRPVAAEQALSLYQAMEIVTGTDMRERPRGFALCLTDVLVKVSGDPRLRSDPRVVALGPHAADYVQSFGYVDPIASEHHHDDQGTYDRSQNLTVGFDPAKIDALLVSLGEQPWRGPRPVLAPVLSLHGRKPPPYLLTADEPLAAEQRAAFARLAADAAVDLRFPTAAEAAEWGVGPNAIADTAPCSPAGTIVVRGTVEWSETALGWVGTWRACWQGHNHSWTIRGVGYDLAFANIIEGATLLAAGHGDPERLAAPSR